MRQMTVQELSVLLAAPEPKPLLLDVREPHEFAHCRIEGSLNIPMNSVPGRLAELDPNAAILTICHHGMRSGSVANYLIGRGFINVTNLQGGVDAWARLVDPSMPRY
jgi:rhodanese-related sulfurtransferase